MLLSVRLQDEAAFERNFLQLKTYYTDSRCASPAACSQVQPKERAAAALCPVVRQSGSACLLGRSLLPASKAEALMTGLNLMRLLVQNRIAEFHTELEVLPAEASSFPCLRLNTRQQRKSASVQGSHVCICFQLAPTDLHHDLFGSSESLQRSSLVFACVLSLMHK